MARGLNRFGIAWTARRLAVVLLACAPVPSAMAQSVTDFRLPPRETAAPRPQGPVDSDAPVVRAVPRPVPTATTPPPPPQPSPSPSATATTPASIPSAITTPLTKRANGSVPAPAASSIPSPLESGTAAPGAAASDSAGQDQSPVAVETFEPSPGQQAPFTFDWLWLAGLGGILALLALVAILRRKPEADDEEVIAVTDEAPIEAEPASYSEPQPNSELPPALPPTPAPLFYGGAPREPLAISLEVGRLNATLVNTTLTWQLMVENRGDADLGPVMIAGDMIAAHASLPVEQQLATDGQPLELRDQIAVLAPGESKEIRGEFRVPLSAINPIRTGTAILFIPLARFRVEAEGASTLATFAIGEIPPVAAAALLPFRLDLGPRTWQRIDQRRIEAPPQTA